MQAQQTKQEWPVEELWVDTVGVRSVEIDWAERWNEGDGWESYEAPECGECGAGKTIDADARYTINACLRTADVAEHQARSTRERLTSQYGGPDA